VSCPSEASWFRYTEGELPLTEVREAESHLVRCQACRALVMALREETRGIVDALHGREPDSLRVPEVTAPAGGLALGFPAAIVVVALVLAAAGLVAESRLPGGLDLLHPLRLKGAYEMVFDLIFGLRDRAPGLFEFAVAVAAVVSTSALGSLLIGALVRRVAGTAALLVASCGLLAAPEATALELRLDQDTRIGAGETLAETLVASGEEVRIDGLVEGDVVAWARRVTLSGRVEGDVFVFARELVISGEVTGGVIAVAEQIRVEGVVSRSVYSLAERFHLESAGRLERDATLFGDRIHLEGSVARDAVFGGERFELGGKVGRDLEVLHAHRVALLDGARVAGDIDAMISDDSEIELDPGAVVLGDVNTTSHSHAEAFFAAYRRPGFYLFFAIQLVASWILGVLLYMLWPQLFSGHVATTGAFLRSMGWGLATLVVTPFVLIGVGFTIVGIPLAVLGLFTWVTAIYVADIAVGALIGRALLQPDASVASFARALLVGLGVIVVGHLLPFLGGAVGWVSLLLGMGLLADRARGLLPARA
jgi:cytoskeletal protein CcmA (bactofilin family)